MCWKRWQDTKAACDAPSSNLETDDPAASTELDVETLIMQHVMFSEEDMEAFINYGKTTNELKPVTQEVTRKTIMMILGNYW
jgi:hypothetical protein